MTSTTLLLEPSLALALEAVERTTDLPKEKKRHWACSLRQIAKWLDRSLEVIPARWTAIRSPVSRLHHAWLGVTAKTLANHKSNAAAALRWFGQENNVAPRGVLLSADWAALREAIQDLSRRARLYGLMRFSSGRGIEPDAVNDDVLAEYLQYRGRTTAMASGDMARRSIARSWNICVDDIAGWPKHRLSEPALKIKKELAWESFPAGLRGDIDAYLAGLNKIRKGANGRRSRPCSAKTINARRAELMAVVRMAVHVGIPLEHLTSLGALLDPEVVEPVIEAYWKKNGLEPKVFTIDLGWKLLSLARQCGLDGAALGRLEEIRDSLEEYRQGGLTAKNLTLVRHVLTDGIWRDVVSQPQNLMREARANLVHAPVKAALTAQLAVAVAILTFAPVRLGNLVSIELDKNLIKPGGPASPFWLVFPHYDVKNRVDLEFPFDAQLTGLINEYIHDFRPILLRGSNAPWLFPGVAGEPKTANMFSTQITERIHKATGLRITVHQFRHACAAIFLKHRPGQHETVRRLLGHRNIQTTINFYSGLQTTQASEDYGKIIRDQIQFKDEVGMPVARGARRPRTAPRGAVSDPFAAARSVAGG